MKKWLLLVFLSILFAGLLNAQVKINDRTTIDFATIDKGRAILGAKDDYTAKLNKFDFAARMRTTKEVNELDYCALAADSVINWTDEEMKASEPVLEQVGKDFSFIKWQFPPTVYLIKTNGKEENSMSYTRSNGVVLPGRGGIRGKGVLEHELFHVLSRFNLDMRDQLYAVIGFKRCNEIVIPSALSQLTIANPDCPKIQHYIELTYQGKKIDAALIWYARRPYDFNTGGGLSRYEKTSLMVVEQDPKDKLFKAVLKDGQPVLLNINDVNGFYEQVGRNTSYLIHPEEAMADNFAMLVSGRAASVKSPEILEKIRAVLSKNEQAGKAVLSKLEQTGSSDPKIIELPRPRTEGGKPLMEALKARQSLRQFSNKKIPLDVLSNLLWAADGINRPDGRRTAPTANNRQEISIYAAMSDGLYLYDAKANTLNQVLAEDIRGATGTQPFVATAPLNLVYVADFSKLATTTEIDRTLYSAADTGFISQNVYLFCASEGLSTVVRGLVDRAKLSKIMNLKENQRIILAQTVGYSPEK